MLELSHQGGEPLGGWMFASGRNRLRNKNFFLQTLALRANYASIETRQRIRGGDWAKEAQIARMLDELKRLMI
jgi:hypothetical protein